MTTTTRRNIIVGAAALPLLPALAVPVTLPLLPVAAFATPGNATDAAWSAYEAAWARYDADKAARDAVEADRVDGILADVRALNGAPQAGAAS